MKQRNIKLLIAFDGTNYSGWQRQKNAPTIQGAIEDSLGIMVGTEITLHGAGRTDAGVHAKVMVANFATESTIPCKGFVNGLNSMLPKDIRVLQADEVENTFHSRYNAKGKTYSYTLFTGTIPMPTDRLYTAHYPGPFNSNAVIQALKDIRGTHDFSSFEATGSRDLVLGSGRGAVRTLFTADLFQHNAKPKTWVFSFTGDGFLRHMVRNLVGTLMEVGADKISPDDFRTILNARNREKAGPTAPACGLVLEMVHYKPLDSTQ